MTQRQRQAARHARRSVDRTGHWYRVRWVVGLFSLGLGCLYTLVIIVVWLLEQHNKMR